MRLNHKSQITNHKLGFTLIELLVVVAIIGLLSSIISVALNTSRTKARDTKRISDMKQVKNGLDLYYANGSGYPEKAAYDAAAGSQLSCSGTVVLQVPRDPLSSTYAYTYNVSGASNTGCGGTVRSNYTIQFYIENKGAYYTIDQDGKVTDSTGSAVSFDSLL